MKTLASLGFAAVVSMGLMSAVPAHAEDCDYMIGQINEALKTTDISQEKKNEVMQLRDQGMAQAGAAGGDCTTTLEQAMAILAGEE